MKSDCVDFWEINGSRPPRGGRGLKSEGDSTISAEMLSPPSRGAWIEISVLQVALPARQVAPLAGGVD